MRTLHILLGMIVVCSSCEQDAGKRGRSSVSQVHLTEEEYDGMKLFMLHCNRCHPAGTEGAGPALVGKRLPRFVIRTQIRWGVGQMPGFSKDELSATEVNGIVAFVKKLEEIEGQQLTR